MTSTIGIPIKLLNEAAGHIVTLEITSGEVYRGKLIEAEDNMNVQLKDITVTARDGRVSHLEQVYIRGSHWGQYNPTPAPTSAFELYDPASTMDIKNPRRILTVGAPGSGVLSILKELTGSAPEPTTFEGKETTAGLSHEWHLETKYYTATLPIWLDEITDVPEWRAEFTKPEAREVVTVLGGWIYCFKKPIEAKDLDVIRDTMQAISDVIECACGYAGETVCLAVALPQSTTPHLEKSNDEWDALCMQHGFEYIDSEATGKNEFGEAVGIPRIRESMEAGEWESSADLDIDGDVEGFESSFAAEEAEMNLELFDMKDTLHGKDGEGEPGEKDVEELEIMMRKMVAIKEMGEGMEEVERKRFAAKAVNDLMKEL